MRKRLILCIASLILLQTPSAFAQAAPALDAASRAQVIDKLIQELTANYVFPDVAAKIAIALRDKQQRGGYDSAARMQDLATMLTADLRESGHDLHLNVRASEQPMPPMPAPGRTPSPDDEVRMVARAKELNYGLGKVEKLAGNIGYLELRGFGPVKYTDKALAAAMTQLADSDALIIDLRGNGGGDPAGVAFLSSYLFDQRTHLNDLYWREGERTEEFWTSADVPGKKFGQRKPVYVLTGPRTFSGAEEFSYNLQQLKRATLVGETTGGGANPGRGRPLNAYMTVFVPNGRAINPITKTNWEHVGVVPEVKVPAADALQTAQKLALARLAVPGKASN